MAMGGDDDVARNGGETVKGALATWRSQHRGVSCNLWNDRLFVEGLPQTMSRPLRVVSRRLLGVSEVVALLPKCRRGLPSVHRGAGLGVKSRCGGRCIVIAHIEVERYRRKGYVPGELASGVCGTGVKRCQRGDPCKGWRRSLDTLSVPDTLTAPLVGFVGKVQWCCRGRNGEMKYDDAPGVIYPLCPT